MSRLVSILLILATGLFVADAAWNAPHLKQEASVMVHAIAFQSPDLPSQLDGDESQHWLQVKGECCSWVMDEFKSLRVGIFTLFGSSAVALMTSHHSFSYRQQLRI
ncbi:MAG: hypothetical protein JST14_05855 [Bacteroidetes bacterium]|nr:hypothetical protein [Bacteroidota bacterium]MBS1977460.1 hypothetical protein [Bacteroidota bacterium]